MLKYDPKVLMDEKHYRISKKTKQSTIRANSRIDFMIWNRLFPNYEKNRDRIAGLPKLSSRFGQWNGENCLVVGSGPSCKKNIKNIRKAVEMGWRVISVDRAHVFLKKNGVRPDITISIDGGKKIPEFFDGVEIGSDEIFALCVTSHPDVYERLGHADIHCFACANPFSELWRKIYAENVPELTCLRPGNVVTFSAVDLALWMGCKKIVTIGNDLCWHADDRIQWEMYKGFRISKVGGGLVSTEAFIKAAKVFRFFKNHHGKDAKFIDASMGIVKGWKQIPLEKVLSK